MAEDARRYVHDAIVDNESRRIIDAWAVADANTAEAAKLRAEIEHLRAEAPPAPESAPSTEEQPAPESSKVDTRALAEGIRNGTADSNVRSDLRDLARQIRGD